MFSVIPNSHGHHETPPPLRSPQAPRFPVGYLQESLLSLKLWFIVPFRQTARMANLESSLKQGVLFATYCSNFIDSEAKEANNIS